MDSLFVDVDDLPQGGYGLVQLLFLAAAYGFILFKASKLIADGAEMLLLVLPATLVGAVLLPVFGAVPDGAIVLFSGLGPDAQSQLSVGVGTLAGSTIMLLTIPWGACVALGRVDLAEDGKSALYKQKPRLTKGWSLTRTGVQATSDVTANAWIMLATAVSYLVIQGPAWANNMTAARGAALGAFLLSGALFIGYCVYQLLSSRSQEMQKARQSEARTAALAHHVLSLADLIRIEEEEAQKEEETAAAAAGATAADGSLNTTAAAGTAGTGGALVPRRSTFIRSASAGSGLGGVGSRASVGPGSSNAHHVSSKVLRRIFDRYDTDKSGELSKPELRAMFKELGFHVGSEELEDILKRIGGDDKLIQFEEFESAILYFLTEHAKQPHPTTPSAGAAAATTSKARVAAHGDAAGQSLLAPGDHASVASEEEEEEDEEEEEEEGMGNKTPFQIKLHAFALLLLGVALVTIFSDPMVTVLSAFAGRIGVNVFYVSFIVTPLISNASELISSVIFASRKTSKSITLTFSQLLGAATMNNTFCLAIFLALVYFKNLTWEFSAEVTTILIVEAAMCFIAIFPVTPMWRGYLAMSLFPLSIVLVYLLENVAGMN